MFHDDVDKLIHPLNPTPARKSLVASWTSVTAHGLRRRNPTTLVEVNHLLTFVSEITNFER